MIKRAMKRLLYLTLLIIFSACDSSTSYESSYDDYEEEDTSLNGEYCAEINYYYPRTGTESTYTLEVTIEDNYLTTIHWPNGGWLDDSHFYSPEVIDNYAEFTSDRGMEYEVEIIGDAGNCSLSFGNFSESSIISSEKEKICPKCGEEKYGYDDYCDDCTDEIENTCSRCGGYDLYVNGGLCDDCQEEEEDY